MYSFWGERWKHVCHLVFFHDRNDTSTARSAKIKLRPGKNYLSFAEGSTIPCFEWDRKARMDFMWWAHAGRIVPWSRESQVGSGSCVPNYMIIYLQLYPVCKVELAGSCFVSTNMTCNYVLQNAVNWLAHVWLNEGALQKIFIFLPHHSNSFIWQAFGTGMKGVFSHVQNICIFPTSEPWVMSKLSVYQLSDV